jgi:hypothetical protein
MSQTKAVHLKNFKKYIAEHGGDPVWTKVLAKLNEQDRAVVTKPIFTGEWLDYHLWFRLLCVADQILGNGDGRVITEIGAFDARENLKGIYSVFISFMKPEFIAARSSLVWRRYYDSGDMKVLNMLPQGAELELVDFPDVPKGHEHELVGWMGEALRITGVKNVQVLHPVCKARGGTRCLFQLHWEKP